MCIIKRKPVIASVVDVAASSGYYIAMTCDEIVAEELPITGSIGVVTSKFNLETLNKRIGKIDNSYFLSFLLCYLFLNDI